MLQPRLFAASFGAIVALLGAALARPIAAICRSLGLWVEETAYVFEYSDPGDFGPPLAAWVEFPAGISPSLLAHGALLGWLGYECFRIFKPTSIVWLVVAALLVRLVDVVVVTPLTFFPSEVWREALGWRMSTLAGWLPDPTSFFDTYHFALVGVLTAGLASTSAKAVPSPVATLDSRPGFPYGPSSPMELNRLFLVSLMPTTSATRRALLDSAQDRHHGPLPEPGIDTYLALGFAKYLDRRDLRFRFAYVLCGLLILIGGVGAESASVVSAGILSAILVRFLKVSKERTGIAPLLQQTRFDPDSIRASEWIEPSRAEKARVASAGQNVVVYSGFDPFTFAGSESGSWSVAIDVQRGREDLGSRVDPKPIETRELYDELAEAARAAYPDSMASSDMVLVSGVQPPKEVLATRLSKPISQIAPDAFEVFVGGRDERIRHYRWLQLPQYGGELVQSWLIRCSCDDRNLFVEVARRIHSPVAATHRWVDRRAPVRWFTALRWLQESLVVGPVVAVFEAFGLPFRLAGAARRLLGLDQAAVRRAISLDPLYDYGRSNSLRTMVGGTNFTHYFQKVDTELGKKAVDREIFNALIDYLNELDIDTSELRDGQSTVLNNGIIVHGGDVSAETLAVGDRAKATKKSLGQTIGRIRKSPVGSKGGG